MTDYNPLFKGGTFLLAVSAPVTGGQLLEVTGVRTCGPASATSTKVIGVAAFDAAVSGYMMTVYPRRAVHVSLVKSATVLAPGSPVKAAANGQIDLWVSATDDVRALLGYSLDAATGDGLAVTAAWAGI